MPNPELFAAIQSIASVLSAILLVPVLIFTIRYAKATQDLAHDTKRLADETSVVNSLQSRQLEAITRPVISWASDPEQDYEVGFFASDGRMYPTLRLLGTNSGGPAWITDIRLEGWDFAENPIPRPRLIPTGTTCVLELKLNEVPREGEFHIRSTFVVGARPVHGGEDVTSSYGLSVRGTPGHGAGVRLTAMVP